MNIFIPQSWLKDYIETDVSPVELAKKMSAHAFNVERTNEIKGDIVWEAEITTNRSDALSIMGIARELKSLLPKKDYKFKYKESKAQKTSGKDKLEVEIRDKNLVPRFSAIVLDEVQIKESPEWMRDRLEKVGTRPLNNVIDITNYLMFDLGQPMHAFDYDKIKSGKMILRDSRAGEKVITLDGMERELPQGMIVIEDGEGRLIDLCGIMGAKNSEIDENTKKVLLFVQVYDPMKIRRASMTLGHRTEAATRFEKGIDFEGVLPALWKAVEMSQELAGGKISSDLIDIVNIKPRSKEVEIDYEKINLLAGVEIEKSRADEILESLGFEIKGKKAKVPSWRLNDIDIPEDLAEEVIRIYGYHNLPSKLLAGEIPRLQPEKIFYWEGIAKNFLKHNGFFECYNYSASSCNAGENQLELLNPLTEKIACLRVSLIPQLTEVLDKNKGYAEKIKVFELAAVYLPRQNDIPDQPSRLGIAVKGVEYLELKGIIEAMLYNEMNIAQGAVDFEISKGENGYLTAELDFEKISQLANNDKIYIPISQFNSIKEDLTLVVPENVEYPQIKKAILAVDPRIKSLDFKDIYKNALTLSIEYLDRQKQISSDDTQKIRQNIFANLEKDLGVRLKK
ncbi:MAG: Phenylalanine-tRNA ligase beta subunit [Parcubacteria group bacterium GW2011_GWA1_42_7]|nr:MAG: Phenylalanine-tRNA ligase beta subunit [Parcubacteria group bacterium GW2011_GWB1_42_6]KKS70241.1 MAG: Phenylalanine-tRNA ligase beta subunit [Parcubacteria group bacterium GW2011_GWA1_42_7]KKS92584.1 MAG: phenylalanyl-tRNA synthetase subunit beta, phenylalanyl-tRNA synthetase beta chain [Parcubacteria group bacterium GW2011_GWC1_43_12]